MLISRASSIYLNELIGNIAMSSST